MDIAIDQNVGMSAIQQFSHVIQGSFQDLRNWIPKYVQMMLPSHSPALFQHSEGTGKLPVLHRARFKRASGFPKLA
jgi:hypothetical protein